MNLSEALDRARRERNGEVVEAPYLRSVPSEPLGARCPECETVGLPELIDLARNTVDMACPACRHVWVADRSRVPTA